MYKNMPIRKISDLTGEDYGKFLPFLRMRKIDLLKSKFYLVEKLAIGYQIVDGKEANVSIKGYIHFYLL